MVVVLRVDWSFVVCAVHRCVMILDTGCVQLDNKSDACGVGTSCCLARDTRLFRLLLGCHLLDARRALTIHPMQEGS